MGIFFKLQGSVKQKVKFGVGLSILLLLISAIFSLQSINRLIEHQNWVNHTNIVLGKLERIVSEVKDLETGQRGFQITNDKAFLEPYYGSKEKVFELYYELRNLTSNIPSQQRRLDTLKPLIDKKYELINKIISLDSTGQHDKAKAIVASRVPKEIMNRIREVINQMREKEKVLLVTRSEEARASIRKAIFIIILTIFIALAIAITSFILILRDITKSDQMKKQLALSNNQLEESMEELATREEQLRDFNLQLESKIEERTRALAASEQSYRFMAESIPAIVWTANSDGKIDYYNKKFGEYTDQAIEDQEALVWEPLLHPDDLELTAEAWNKALTDGSDYQMEFRLKNREGEYRWFLARALPLKGPQGNIIKWFGSSTDIHDQKLAQEQHKLQAKIIENINEGVLVADENGTIIYTNPAQDRLFGYNHGELLGQKVSVQHAFTPEENEAIVSDILRKLEINDTWSGTFKNKRKDGATFISYNTISSLDFNNKKLYVSIRRDITEEIKNKEALEYQSRLNKTITDNATSCLIMMNAKGYCTFINPAGEKMFGYSLEELKEKPLHYMIHHHHPDGSFYPMEECPIDRALPENFDIRSHQDVFIRKDGTFFPVSCAASPIFEGGVPVATVIEVRDVTEEKRAQKEIIENNAELNKKNIELERINKDLDNFIYTASHDLKAPVSNIEGLIYTLNDIIKAGEANPDEQSEIINLIENSISRFKETIEDLTEISKVQKDLADDVQEVDVDNVFKDIISSIRKMVETSNTSFKINFDECKKIRFSKVNLRSILSNLITNSIKYRSPERSPFIEVSCKKIENYTLLYVKDNGLGIKREQQDKIFGMFKRMHTHVDGTGIGLYIVKRMIENAGGKIEVESEEGIGSTFKVYFKR